MVDVENPPGPLAQPANSISITSCGAVADNNPTNGSADSQAVDSTSAIQSCIDQAQSQGKVLWIPAGTFYLKGTAGLHATGITIAGAGPWYSTIYRAVPLPNSTPLGAIFQVHLVHGPGLPPRLQRHRPFGDRRHGRGDGHHRYQLGGR